MNPYLNIMKKTVLLSSLVLFVGSSATAMAASAVNIKPVSTPPGFIKGADISTLNVVQTHGGIFYNRHNKSENPLKILKDNGFNYVRLRLWNDPKDKAGHPYGGGNNDLATDIKLAKAAHQQGLKLLLDFHYSDFWTDPGKQFKPKAWANYDFNTLKKALHQYTLQSVKAFKKAGVTPDMIQIGNEINGGILWPTGKSWGQGGGEFDRLAALLKSGISGAKQAAPHAKIMLHLAKGADENMFKWWFGEITKRHVPFDIIGVSFYPYWDGSIQALQANLNKVSEKYHKDVIVVETQYGYTTKNCDNAENNFGKKEAAKSGYPASVQGQADYLHDLIQSIVNIKDHRGKGLFYWEPLWLPVHGATWATQSGMKYIHDKWKEGNSRENQDLFNCNGHVLPSIQEFN
ncbi:MAG: Arabinogalactan endo-beta-1,4-galactanase [Candidatus Celerinatantimonas neptuna]|nr:MAG: Arabinogalactan endo-beta-1,4-galactanase [Candidatus Celerinatantimonas neptuna]